MTDPTNAQRAESADQALSYYYRLKNHGDMPGLEREDTIADLIADMIHLCRREHIDYDICARHAEMHFDAEREG